MTSSGDAGKKTEPEDLAGAAIEPEDQEGLSTSEVTVHLLESGPAVVRPMPVTNPVRHAADD